MQAEEQHPLSLCTAFHWGVQPLSDQVVLCRIYYTTEDMESILL